jgi:hypothetical protein
MTMIEGMPDVVAAPARRPTLLGFAAALGNAMLGAVVVLVVVAAVVLAVQAVTAAVSFVVEISDSRGGR